MQIIVFVGEMVIAGVFTIVTVATADEKHEPLPSITVYVVVIVGVTTIVAELIGFGPLLAIQVKGPAPDAVRV